MPFCANCGAPVEGKFCGKCGSAVVADGPQPVPPPGTPTPMMNPVAAPLQENVASALCYALGLITGIVFLVLQPYNQNRAIRFHAFQSIFGNVVLIAADIVLGILFPWGYAGFLATIGYLIWRVFELGCIGVWLYMIISTYQGKKIVLPGVGPLAEKQA